MSDQLALFGMGNDARPLPEIIASGGSGWSEFPLQYHDVDGKRYYAVQDWIAGVSGSDNPRQALANIKRRYKDGTVRTEKKRGQKPITPEHAKYIQDQLLVSLVQLKYHASNGKNYTMDFATDEGLYLITQLIEAESEVRNHILAYLAKAGVALDEMRRDPGLAIDAGIAGYKRQGKSDAWIEQRNSGKIKRNEFTDAIQAALSGQEQNVYARATDTLSVGLFDRTTKRLRDELGLAARVSLRDHMPQLALMYIAITEAVISQELGSSSALTWAQAEPIIVTVAALIRPQITATSQYLGIDIATGARLLTSGKRHA